jgi:hypothetical protein
LGSGPWLPGTARTARAAGCARSRKALRGTGLLPTRRTLGLPGLLPVRLTWCLSGLLPALRARGLSGLLPALRARRLCRLLPSGSLRRSGGAVRRPTRPLPGGLLTGWSVGPALLTHLTSSSLRGSGPGVVRGHGCRMSQPARGPPVGRAVWSLWTRPAKPLRAQHLRGLGAMSDQLRTSNCPRIDVTCISVVWLHPHEHHD